MTVKKTGSAAPNQSLCHELTLLPQGGHIFIV